VRLLRWPRRSADTPCTGKDSPRWPP
jgi:hypothetical protein